MAQPFLIEVEEIEALNNELPSAYRSPSPASNHKYVILKATETFRGVKLIHAKQTKDIGTLKEELAAEKEKAAGNANAASKDLEDSFGNERNLMQVERMEIERERADCQFCVMELMMYITGEGETRKKINFRKMRRLLEGAREGGMSLKELTDQVEAKFPADQEVIRKRRQEWT